MSTSGGNIPSLSNLFSRLGLLGLEFFEGELFCLVSEEDRFRFGFFARRLGGDLGGEGYFFCRFGFFLGFVSFPILL